MTLIGTLLSLYVCFIESMYPHIGYVIVMQIFEISYCRVIPRISFHSSSTKSTYRNSFSYGNYEHEWKTDYSINTR